MTSWFHDHPNYFHSHIGSSTYLAFTWSNLVGHKYITETNFQFPIMIHQSQNVIKSNEQRFDFLLNDFSKNRNWFSFFSSYFFWFFVSEKTSNSRLPESFCPQRTPYVSISELYISFLLFQKAQPALGCTRFEKLFIPSAGNSLQTSTTKEQKACRLPKMIS